MLLRTVFQLLPTNTARPDVIIPKARSGFYVWFCHVTYKHLSASIPSPPTLLTTAEGVLLTMAIAGCKVQSSLSLGIHLCLLYDILPFT